MNQLLEEKYFVETAECLMNTIDLEIYQSVYKKGWQWENVLKLLNVDDKKNSIR